MIEALIPMTILERVQSEEAELANRIEKLTTFLGDPGKVSMLTPHHVALLRVQLYAMQAYLQALALRVSDLTAI